MKFQMIQYYFKQLKVFFLITTGFSILFMNFVAGHQPKLEAISAFSFVIIVSILIGILQVHTIETTTNSDLYLLHLPLEKSQIWLTRSICGATTIIVYYALVNLFSMLNPSTPLIDLTIILLGVSGYFLSRSISVFISDIVQAIFLSILIIVVLYQIIPLISFVYNPTGVAFPINIHLPYIMIFFISTISSSFYFETKYFRKSIN